MFSALVPFLVLTGHPGLKMPALFSDHMVLQRDRTVNVWGWGTPGEKVTVQVGWAPKGFSGKVGKEGEWSVRIPGSKAGGPYTLTVTSDTTLKFTDVLLGDVWVCSGQSNMEFTVSQTDHAAEDVPKANHPWIRLFHLAKSMKDTPQLDSTGSWQVCSPESVAHFSAAGYFFGAEIGAKTNVPIGLVDTTWGGTEAELWTSEGGLMRLPEFGQRIRDRAKSDDEYRSKLSTWQESVRAKDPGWGKWSAEGIEDADWIPVPTLEPWGKGALKAFDGYVWYRGTLDLSKENLETNSLLDVGVIDDNEETWLNGVKVGATDGWDQHRVYKIPDGLLKPGKNTVVVRVLDTGGEGGWSAGSPTLVNPGNVRKESTGWRYKVGVAMSALPAEPQASGPRNSLLYNGMINPLVRNAIKGAIWYQGEANVGRAFQYRTLFPAMIRDWRNQWGQDFPFYFVQIAPFSGYGSAAAAELREAQNMALDLKHTGVVVITDATGNLADIHPVDKRTVGHRLALWALAKDYGVAGEYSGPLYGGMRIEGSKVRVLFSHSNGLVARSGDLREFELAGADKVFHPAQAVIEGGTVVVSSADVPMPVAVRMGWSAAPQPNLFNSAGLPVSPFRSDNWPGLTDNAKW